MATITPTRTPGEQAAWGATTENDTPAAVEVPGGRYTFTVEGTFGGATFELQYSKGGSTYHSIDATNLLFSADGSYNIEISKGYLKPVRTGGSSTSVLMYLTPIT